MLRFAIAASQIALIVLTLAIPTLAVAGDEGTTFVSCGNTEVRGPAPTFELEYTQSPTDPMFTGTIMSVTHFQPTANGPLSTSENCRITEVTVRGETLSLGNTSQGCRAEIQPIPGSALVQVTILKSGETFTGCQAKASPTEIATQLQATDIQVHAVELTAAAAAPSPTPYDVKMDTLVRPNYAKGVDGKFPGVDGVPIAYKVWKVENEQGAVVLLPGRGDAFATFDETIYDFTAKGYSVYAMDERGQGASGRLLPPDSQLSYVEHFGDYVTDLETFINTVVGHHGRMFLVAHSMGGAIAALYGEKHASDFTGIVLVAPMLKINPAPFTMLEAELIEWIEGALGRSKDPAPGQKPYDPNATFAKNVLTTSEPRWNHLHSILNGNSTLQLGGATIGWVHEAFAADATIHDGAPTFAPSTLLLTAGNDRLVDNAEEAYFCAHALHCEQAPIYTMAMHNILAEQDATREDALARIFAFFGQQHSAPLAAAAAAVAPAPAAPAPANQEGVWRKIPPSGLQQSAIRRVVNF